MRKEIEPRDEQIGGMRDTIKELDDELQRDYRSSVALEQALAERQVRWDLSQTQHTAHACSS